MKPLSKILALLLAASFALSLGAQNSVSSPDGRLKATVSCDQGRPTYRITCDGIVFLEDSPLGLTTDVADLSEGLAFKGLTTEAVADDYEVPTIKASSVRYRATRGIFSFTRDGKAALDIIFQVSNRDVAFRYLVHAPDNHVKACKVLREATGYVFPKGTTTFITPQMEPMGGWSRTAPSYEKIYEADAPTGLNGEGYGYTFPCLFRNSDKGWILISETGVNGSYCASRIDGLADGSYRLAFPFEEEFNGKGSASPDIPVPGMTPWRTLTVGRTLAPIVETTVAWDLVEPAYEPRIKYRGAKGSWSWIIKQDKSINYDDQKEYIDFSAAMGWQTVLVDNWWDTQIGREGIEKLARYASFKGIKLFLWYNSNGDWNDAPQGPRNIMNIPERRREEMEWLRDIGVRGIKVDFFGSDKQITMQLYEDILTDANDFGLQVIFHGCTLPRGWERMYPNFASAEAVMASENLCFTQKRCDEEAVQATFLPFIRNSLAAMDFGGSTLNKVYNSKNDPSRSGTVRRTSDVFALATAVLFQSPVQHFALAPNNLTDAPSWAIGFMKKVPTTWDEVRFIDGYPGSYLILARRSGNRWYIAGINAEPKLLKLSLNLPMLVKGPVSIYSDDASLRGSCSEVQYFGKALQVSIPCNGGFVLVQ